MPTSYPTHHAHPYPTRTSASSLLILTASSEYSVLMLWLVPVGTEANDAEGFVELTVGRALSNDLVLPHDDVSAHHALFEYRGRMWTVRDLDSMGGTFIGGLRITTRLAVIGGDEIRFGARAKFQVVRADPPRMDDGKLILGTEPTRPTLILDDELLLELRSGTQGGVLAAVVGGHRAERDLGAAFDLLVVLAHATRPGHRDPEGWVDDQSLRVAIWGPTHRQRTSDAFYRHVRRARDALAEVGVSRRILEKRRAQTRLALPASQIVVS